MDDLGRWSVGRNPLLMVAALLCSAFGPRAGTAQEYGANVPPPQFRPPVTAPWPELSVIPPGAMPPQVAANPATPTQAGAPQLPPLNSSAVPAYAAPPSGFYAASPQVSSSPTDAGTRPASYAAPPTGSYPVPPQAAAAPVYAVPQNGSYAAAPQVAAAPTYAVPPTGSHAVPPQVAATPAYAVPPTASYAAPPQVVASPMYAVPPTASYAAPPQAVAAPTYAASPLASYVAPPQSVAAPQYPASPPFSAAPTDFAPAYGSAPPVPFAAAPSAVMPSLSIDGHGMPLGEMGCAAPRSGCDASSGGGCGGMPGCGCGNPQCGCHGVDLGGDGSGDWASTLSVFIGLDGSKQPQDVGINANFGGRTAINWGLPLWEEAGLGFQIGTAFTFSDNAVQVLAAVDGADDRAQSLTTVGLFRRSEDRFEWALAWDFLYESSYDQIALSQLRARTSIAIGEAGKLGVWGTWSDDSSAATVGGQAVSLRPIDQVSVFWNHTWASGVETEAWGGVALGHGENVFVFPGNPSINTAPVFGAMIHVPLNDHMAIYGQGNFILPADSGTVDSYLGVVFYFDKLRRARGSRYAPALDVAGSTTFAVDLYR